LITGIGVLFRPDVGLVTLSIGITLVVSRLLSSGVSLEGEGEPKRRRRLALPAQSKMLALMTREPNWSRHHHVIAFE